MPRRPDLSGLIPVSEVARMIGHSRQRVDQLAGTPGFPKPAYEWPPRIRLWWRSDIQAWMDAHGYSSGYSDQGPSRPKGK